MEIIISELWSESLRLHVFQIKYNYLVVQQKVDFSGEKHFQ